MLDGVAYGWIWKYMSWLPGYLLRLFFSRADLAKRIHIDVRPRHTPVQISGGDVSEANIWLEVHNNGYFPIELDRLTAQLYLAGYPVEFFLLDRTPIPADSKREVFLRGPIQSGVIRHYALNLKNGDIVSLNVRAEFNCKVHNFTVKADDLSGIQARNINIPNVATAA